MFRKPITMTWRRSVFSARSRSLSGGSEFFSGSGRVTMQQDESSGIAVVTLDNPGKKNAFLGKFVDAIHILSRLEKDILFLFYFFVCNFFFWGGVIFFFFSFFFSVFLISFQDVYFSLYMNIYLKTNFKLAIYLYFQFENFSNFYSREIYILFTSEFISADFITRFSD